MMTANNADTATIKAQDFGDQMVNQYRDIKLLGARSIFMSEAVNSNTAKKVVADLLSLDSENQDPIYLYLNSPGGEVNSGFAIYDTIRFIGAPVTVISSGLCASIATIINIAVDKKRRYSLPNSKFLIHQPLISGQIYGQASDIEITATQILKTREKINRLLADACGQAFEKVEEDTSRDYWMSAEEAKDYGLIGKVIVNRKELC